MAQFYVALYPVGGPNLDPNTFFQLYLAGPFLIVLYLIWKIYSWFKVPSDRPFFIALKDIDIYTGMREGQRRNVSGQDVSEEVRRASITSYQEGMKKRTVKDHLKSIVGNVF
jgi:amino acid transporter